jgi:DNA-binding LytR/AlgR family response regulator
MEETVQLFTSEILFFESYNRKVVIHLNSGEIYTTHMKISLLEQELRSRNFVRTHMSFLVNVKYIRKINRLQVIVKYQEQEYTLPISRKQKDLVENAFLDYRVGDCKL